MAKTLYDYWFVQFEFPDTNGKPYKSSGGKMIWNEKLKREIPEGWRNGDLAEIAKITMGQSPDGETYNDNGKGIVFYQGCTDFGLRFPTVRQFTTAPARIAEVGDILLSVRAPVGTTNFANTKCCIGRGLAAINSRIGSITHLYYVIQDMKTIFDQKNVNGTTFGSITKADLFSLTITKPSQSVVDNFENVVDSIFQKQFNVAKQNQHLTTLRDWLLPMLMNGQVKVSD